MTARNITPSADVVSMIMSNMAQNNEISFATAKTSMDFQSFMTNANGTKGIDITKVKSAPESTNTKIATALQNDRIKTETSKQDTVEADELSDKVEEVISDIRDTVKETLGISDEELEKNLAELGITIADLVEPQNVAMLIAKVENVDVANVITDENLTDMLKSIVSDVTEIVSAAVEELGISPEAFMNDVKAFSEELKAAISDTKEQQDNLNVAIDNKTEDKPVQVFTVKDEATGKEVKVTVESETEVKETVTKVDTVNISDKGSDNKNNSNNEHSDNQGIGNTVLQNLQEAISQTVEVTESFSDVYGVDQTEIINQVLDAIKVNVTADTSSMELQLNPENLGRVNLNVAAKDGVITATITAQNESVKTIIENQIIQLKESLNNQGLKVNEVSVTVSAHGFEMNGENNKENEQNGQTSANRRRFRTDDELFSDDEAVENIIEKQIMEANGNNVSYRA